MDRCYGQMSEINWFKAYKINFQISFSSNKKINLLINAILLFYREWRRYSFFLLVLSRINTN